MGLLEAHPWLYGTLLHTHRAAVTTSVLLFTARGVGVLLNQSWPKQWNWRMTSVTIDTLLLLAGASLWVLMAHNPLQEPWLGAKLALLPVYIVLGALALGRASRPWQRQVCLVAALGCAATIVSMALSRSPWGWLEPWIR